MRLGFPLHVSNGSGYLATVNKTLQKSMRNKAISGVHGKTNYSNRTVTVSSLDQYLNTNSKHKLVTFERVYRFDQTTKLYNYRWYFSNEICGSFHSGHPLAG